MLDFSLRCRGSHGNDAVLAGWRKNVGGPLGLDLAPPTPTPARTLVVLDWNIWIGRGDLASVVERVRGGAYASEGFPPGVPFVALIQEAYRQDDSVPAIAGPHFARDASRRSGHEHEIGALARQLQLNLRYMPSMRNGPAHSDRGNAILSSLPLIDSRADELPYCYQRRVAVSATIQLGSQPLRLHSAHLDPRGRRARDLFGIAGRLRQARAFVEAIRDGDGMPHLLGADLNLARQRREPAFRVLTEAGFSLGTQAHRPPWRHTYHRLPRLNLDWLLLANARGRFALGALQRLDEHPQDQGPYVFGSDHHPLLARIDLEE